MRNFVVLLLLISFQVLRAEELKKVTLQLSWFDQFQFAGYYIAKEKGFYEELGLDVEIKPFAFGINVPNEVDEGRANFGIGRETLILDRAKGKRIVALYALFQATPLILLTSNDSNINKVEDFVNKKIMTTSDDSSEVSIKAMISSKKVKVEQLHFIKHTHNINDLINKNTDIISAYISKSPFELEEKGVPYKVFDPKDYGFDMYSDFLFTSENMISNDLDTVIAFKEASLKGWEYAYSNIKESVDLIYKKYNPQNISKKALQYEAKELKKLSYHHTKTIGKIKEEKVQRIYDLYNVMGLIPQKIETKEFVYYEDKNKKISLTKEEKNYLNEKNSFKVCAHPSLKPYSYFDNQEFKGFVSDYFDVVSEKTGIEFEIIKSDDFKNSVDLFKNKKCDIHSSLSNAEHRKEYANFTKPYFSIPFVLISRLDFPFIDSLSSLKDKKIGIVGSYNISKRVKKKYPNIEFVDVKDLDEGIEKVLNEEIDGHVDVLYSSLYKLYDKNNFELKISNKLDIGGSLSIGVRNDDKYLFNIINKATNSIDDESIDKLIKPWLTVEYKKSTDYTLLWETLAVVAVIILALLYRQRVLKNANQSLYEKVEEKTEELKNINKNLEQRIKEEVDDNLAKDKLLQRQTKMASMGEMIENIAHQWRQPLSVISTGASGIKLKKEMGRLDDKYLFSSLDSITNSALYLSHTIDDFRFFFKPNKDKKIFILENCFQKTLNIISFKFANENIKIIENIEEIKILGYETELIQVLMNILNNAKDALVGQELEDKLIFVDIYKENNNTVIKIKDNAGGIDSKIIEKVFEPYFTTKHKSQGTGIGLYMCNQIVSKHMNGLLDVSNVDYMHNNKKYTGAEFKIIFYD
ncbi:MAG: ABC transporter substrate-binding protein [Arcobacter sp.]|uniref:ABC transporter substrate-binding protein n=1 Tax=Arcobacter sp. TaxID=1872629 RepID=UPI003B003C56